jgi:hypothetical protein
MTQERIALMHIETQFSVFLINKPGVLAAVTGALAKAKVNIIALTLADAGEHGVLRIVCEDSAKARAVLSKAHDQWTEAEVLVMELENRPGAFAGVAQKLADHHVNVAYAYCTGGAPGGRTTAVFKIPDLIHAKMVLQSAGESPKQADRVRRMPPGRQRGR